MLTVSKSPLIAPLVIALMLSACGGGGQDQGHAAPTVDVAQYDPLVSYCDAAVPTEESAANDGWSAHPSVHVSGNPAYMASSIVSVAGSTEAWDHPIAMHVQVGDYRGVNGRLVPTGYAKPEWVMGVSIPTVLGPRSVACVTQVARLQYPANPYAALPALPGMPALPEFDPSPTLVWRSYTRQAVPIADLPGYAADGFEFVGNFTPADGSVYFVVDKARFASPQSLSICYLSPGAERWDCVPPTVTDGGANWSLTQRGVRQGVYVLTAQTLK